MRNANADQDTIYVVAYNRADAEDWAHEANLTGAGVGKGTGPRPWVFLGHALDIRGRQFQADGSDVKWAPGWWKRADADTLLEYVQLSCRLAP